MAAGSVWITDHDIWVGFPYYEIKCIWQQWWRGKPLPLCKYAEKRPFRCFGIGLFLFYGKLLHFLLWMGQSYETWRQAGGRPKIYSFMPVWISLWGPGAFHQQWLVIYKITVSLNGPAYKINVVKETRQMRFGGWAIVCTAHIVTYMCIIIIIITLQLGIGFNTFEWRDKSFKSVCNLELPADIIICCKLCTYC